MTLVLSASRLLLVVVLIVSGFAKLCDLEGSRRTMSDFHVPKRLVPVGAVALPVTELLVGVLLLPSPTVAAASTAASVLLATFCALIAIELTHGRTTVCHCFGNLHSSPISRALLIRDVALLTLAVLVAAGAAATTPISFVHVWNSWDTATQVVLVAALLVGAVLTFQAWFSLNLLRQNGRIIARLDALEDAQVIPVASPAVHARTVAGLTPGMPAPSFDLVDLNGRHHTLDSVRST